MRVGRDAVLLQVAEHLPAALPPHRVLVRAVPKAEGRTGRDRGEDLLSSWRSESASNDTGSSIAVSASSCSRWFWMTSLAAPIPS